MVKVAFKELSSRLYIPMVVFRKIILIFHVEIQKIHGKIKMSPTEHPLVIFKSLIIFVIIHSDSFTV